jgi:uncharacterized membrane protein YoaK (UPF0700 family)
MRWSLPAIQSLTAGYADASGYLALKGLFTAHVTGNFVTLGSSFVFGTAGALAKTLALPMFCAAVLLSRLLALRLKAAGRPAFRSLLWLETILLTLCAGLAAWLGPFENPDGAPALVLGMTLVAAMAIQNAAHRAHQSHVPPTTVMTGTTTQIMLDLADMMQGLGPGLASTRARFRRMATSIVLFALGCGLAALLFAGVNKWCFCALPVLGVATLLMRDEISHADASD